MKIAFVHQPWSIVRPDEVGADSLVIWIEQVAQRVAARGCQVVCYSRADRSLPAVQTIGGVEHRRVAAPIDRYVKFVLSRIDRLGLRDPTRPGFASPLAYRQFIRNVARDAAEQSIDAIHVLNSSQFIPPLRSALPEARIALHMQCEWLTQLDAKMIAPRLAAADLVIGASDFLADAIRARFPQLAGRIRRIWNGAAIERFSAAVRPESQSAKRRLRVLYVGRVSPEKGIHTLLDAFDRVAQAESNVELHIVGPERIVPYEMIVPLCSDPKVLEMAAWFRGGYTDYLRRQVASIEGGRATWIDRDVSHAELPKFYADGDIFVFPSVWEEPFGMPLVEAMASGLPCIATRGGAFPEIVEHGSTGLLVERGNAAELADAILQLVRDDHRRRRMGAAGLARARELFSWDCVADALLEEFKRVAAIESSTPPAMMRRR